MSVVFWSWLSGPCGSGPAGRGCRTGAVAGWSHCVGLVGCGGWCRKHARCGGLLRPCGRGGLLVVGALARACVCGGGMLSGFWGSAPWLPDPSGAPLVWGLWVGVGGLVVNCIVDASILL